MERWLKADVALVKAERGDTHGNLVYRLASRNFNPLMCMAASVTIVQVQTLCSPGDLDAENIHTPGIFVDHVVEVPEAKQEQAMIIDAVEYTGPVG